MDPFWLARTRKHTPFEWLTHGGKPPRGFPGEEFSSSSEPTFTSFGFPVLCFVAYMIHHLRVFFHSSNMSIPVYRELTPPLTCYFLRSKFYQAT